MAGNSNPPNGDTRAQAKRFAEEAARLFQYNKFSEALASAEKALALDPNLGRAHLGKSLSLAQLGFPEEGLRAAEEGIRRDPAYALVYTAAAICLHRLGRDEEARAHFAKALELRPDHPQVLYNYACYWAEKGNEDECRKYLTMSFANLKTEEFLEEARNDPDLARYVETNWFREIYAAAKKRRRDRAGNS